MGKKLIAGTIVAGAIALAPMAAKSVIDSTIETQKTNLAQNGINLNIINNTGYFSSNREFELTIDDEKKFKDFLSSLTTNKDLAYDTFFKSFKKKDMEKFDKFMKGMVFKGNITNSNINPNSDIEAYTYLHKFSDDIMESIKKDETGQKYILPFIKNEGLAFTTVLSNDGKIKTVSFKDINETMTKTSKRTGKTESMKLEFLGHEYINKSSATNIIGEMTLDKMAFALTGNKKSEFALNGVKYDFDYLNELISRGSMSIDSVKVLTERGYKTKRTEVINLNKTTFSSDGFLKDKKYFANLNIENNGIEFKSRRNNLDLKKAKFDLAISNANYEALTKLNKSYVKFQTLSLETQGMTKAQRRAHMDKILDPMLNSLGEVVNSGFDVDASLKLEDFLAKRLNLSDAKVNISATLKENKLNLKTFNKLFLLGVINADINIEMTEDDLKSVINDLGSRVAPMVMMYAKVENKKATFHLSLKDGKIEVNGKKVN